MEDSFRFNEKIPIGYTPKQFYDELVKAQRVFQSDESFNYLEDNLLTQLEKDNLDFINNFEEIKKFRLYYTEQLVYEYLKRNKMIRISTSNAEPKNKSEEWFKPFEITKYPSTKSNTLFNRLKDMGISSILLNIKTTDLLINDILSYSTIPGLFSYFLTDKENIIYINQLDSLVSMQIRSDPNETNYYECIKIYLKGVFKMPTFINFLHKVIYSIITPYLYNEKPFSKKEVPLIHSEIIEKVKQYKSYCPQIMKDIIVTLRQKGKNDEISQNRLCISIFNDCLFDPLQKEPAIFMCSDFPSYEINKDYRLQKDKKVENIIESKLYRNFFNAVFSKSEDYYDEFVFKFIREITDETTVMTNSNVEMNLTMKFNYFYSFDIGLIESDKIDYDSVVKKFKSSYEENNFSLYFYDNVNQFSQIIPNNIDSSIISINSKFEYELIKMIKTAPILSPKSSIPQVRILDIINEYLINRNDPLQVGIDSYRFKKISAIWNKDGYVHFPTNKKDLEKYFQTILNKRSRESNVEPIKQRLKEKGEFVLKLKLSEKQFKNWKYFLNNIIIKNLISVVFIDKVYSDFFFPRMKGIIDDPEKNFRANITIITNNIKFHNKNKMNDFYTNYFSDNKDFKLNIASFFLNCNLKYYNYIFLKPQLKEVDSIFNDLIYSNIGKIIQLIKEKIPILYNNTFGSSASYFTEDVIRMRNAFNANVDPHKKVYLIQNCIKHSIRKIENQFNQNELEYKYFVDLLISFSNPRNLLSNIAFMIDYEYEFNYLNSLSIYFNHFIEFIWSDEKLFQFSNKSIELYHNESIKNLFIDNNFSKNAKEKKIVLIDDSKMKISDALNKIIPQKNFDWSLLDDGKQVEFDVKEKRSLIHCVFVRDDPNKSLDFKGIDVLILFFDPKKEPRRFKEISANAAQNKSVLKIAICNTNAYKKIVILKDYKAVFDHVFEFSNNVLTKK